jgi:hypothetical protein
MTVRGVLLWLVVPAAFCAWLVIGVHLRRRGISLPQFVGWADLNLIAGLQRLGCRGSSRVATKRVSGGDGCCHAPCELARSGLKRRSGYEELACASFAMTPQRLRAIGLQWRDG